MASKAKDSMSPNHFQASDHPFIQIEHYLGVRHIVHSDEQDTVPASHCLYSCRWGRYQERNKRIITSGCDW